jgi:hypothetical protein
MRTGLSLTATLALSVSYLPPAFAQEEPGLIGTLSFSQGIEISDNEDLDSTTSGATLTSRTGLGFALSSETRTESLRFNIGTELVGEYGGGAADEFDVENTSADLAYSREGANARLGFSASYSEIQLEDSVIETTPAFGIGFGSLVIDEGTAKITNLNGSFETGINSPFGVELRAGYFRSEFGATVDPDRTDTERVSLDSVARFQLNPAYTARVLAGISVQNEEDALESESRDSYVGVGLSTETASGLSVTGDIMFDRSETTVLGPVTTTEDGIGVDLSVSQSQPAGSIGFDLSSRISEDGRRTQASVNRSMELPTGELAFVLGIVDQEGDDSLRPLGRLSYRQDTPRGGLTASLSQEPSVDDGDIYTNTRLAVDFAQDIDSTSGWMAGLAYSAVNEVGGTDDDNRATASLAYTRSLTEEWRMRTGLEHIRESTGGGSTESSNTVFFNIERDITFGF